MGQVTQGTSACLARADGVRSWTPAARWCPCRRRPSSGCSTSSPATASARWRWPSGAHSLPLLSTAALPHLPCSAARPDRITTRCVSPAPRASPQGPDAAVARAGVHQRRPQRRARARAQPQGTPPHALLPSTDNTPQPLPPLPSSPPLANKCTRGALPRLMSFLLGGRPRVARVARRCRRTTWRRRSCWWGSWACRTRSGPTWRPRLSSARGQVRASACQIPPPHAAPPAPLAARLGAAGCRTALSLFARASSSSLLIHSPPLARNQI